MSTQGSRYAVLIGVVIALAATLVTAFAFSAKSAGTGPAAQLLAPAAASTSNTITVVGAGTSTAVPDTAIVTIGVSATRANVHDAVAASSADMSQLLGALHGQGVQDKDIQTASVSIYQQNNCCPQGGITFVASNQVVVTIHHLANVSPVIVAAVDGVGNDIQLGGVGLTIGDDAAAVKAARSSAMTDAGVRAQQWAALAGRHVGRIIDLSEIVAAQPSGPCNGCGKGAGGGVPIQPGETSVAVTITVTYELLD